MKHSCINLKHVLLPIKSHSWQNYKIYIERLFVLLHAFFEYSVSWFRIPELETVSLDEFARVVSTYGFPDDMELQERFEGALKVTVWEGRGPSTKMIKKEPSSFPNFKRFWIDLS